MRVRNLSLILGPWNEHRLSVIRNVTQGGFYEHSNESLGTIRNEGFLDQLSKCSFLRRTGRAAYSSLLTHSLRSVPVRLSDTKNFFRNC